MNLLLSHKLYGSRPIAHHAAYRSAPGWWFIELGSWTLEIDNEPGPFRHKVYAACASVTALCYVIPSPTTWSALL